MTKLSAGVLGLLVVALAGCGGGGQEDALIKQEITLNQDTAVAMGKVTDWAGYLEAQEKYAQQRDEIADKKAGWTPKRTRELLQRYGKELTDSQARLGAALEELLPKLENEAANPVLVMDTSMGTVKMQLFEKTAPITVKNFLAYVDDKFYDGTIFHRVIPDFMVQGGGFVPGMQEKKTRAPIKNESYNHLTNRKGTLAMARTPVADSATAQFFINVVDNPPLNRSGARDGVGYAVFGRVVDGMDVVDKIRQVPTTTKDVHESVPVQDVLIRSIRREEKK